MPRGALVVAAGLAFAAGAWAALSPKDAGLSLLLVAVALVAAGFVWLEAGTGSAKEVALVAVLGGTAAAGRVLFGAVPGVQPVTVVAVAAGAALGARVGFAVGAVAALVSNFYLGQGIYAEVTLRHTGGRFVPWEWTYPDYRSAEYLTFFDAVRRRYRQHLAALLTGPHHV